MTRDYHILPHPKGWQVKREGSDRASLVATSKDRAITYARILAKRNKVEVVIHNREGKIEDSDSYGNDPPQVKDKKH